MKLVLKAKQWALKCLNPSLKGLVGNHEKKSLQKSQSRPSALLSGQEFFQVEKIGISPCPAPPLDRQIWLWTSLVRAPLQLFTEARSFRVSLDHDTPNNTPAIKFLHSAKSRWIQSWGYEIINLEICFHPLTFKSHIHNSQKAQVEILLKTWANTYCCLIQPRSFTGVPAVAVGRCVA